MFPFFTFVRRFIFHLSRLFSILTFLGCFQFSPFLAVSFFTFFGCFCVAVLWVLRIWESFFHSQVFSTLYSFPTFATVPQVLRIWNSFVYSQVFFILHSFPTFGTICFYPWEPAALPWRLQGLPVRVETQTRSICLFKSHRLQPKLLVIRFYLCVRSCYRLLN